MLSSQEKLMGWYTAWRVDCEMMALSVYRDWWKTFDTALYETLLSEERGMRHELMDRPLTECGIGWMVTARVVDNSSVAVWRQWYFLRSLQVQLVRFNLFVADLDNAVECTFSEFVGDINFCDVVNTVKKGVPSRGTVTSYRGGSMRTL